MNRRDDKTKKKWATIIDIIVIIIAIALGIFLALYQGLGPDLAIVMPIISAVVVLAAITHIIFMWGIKKGVIVDRRQRRYPPRTHSSYDPISTDSYEFTTSDDELAARPSIAEREEARRQAERDKMIVTVTPQAMKSIKLKSPSVDPSGLNCAVCKLMIRSNQAALECPKCGALFHKKHIHEWLKEHDDCPICNQIISK